MSKFVDATEQFDKYPIIQRKGYADYLTQFLNQQYENGYVLNLNSEWGAGKSTFLKCWYNELKQTHPVIYFDAWKSDFTHDAMTALIDCFHAQLTNPISDNKALIRNLFEKGSFFVKKSIPSLVVGYAKHKTGMPEDESLIKDITTTFNIDVAEKECGDALKEVLKEILEQRKKVEGIDNFKKALEDIAKDYITISKESNPPKEYPIYVLIDELDRCRPNYAIEVIESVKHFFNTKNFVFVIATDSEQLQHSIKAVYGSGFDANLYLSRFFDLSVTLPAPNLKDYLTSEFGLYVYPPFPTDNSILNHEFVVSLIENVLTYHGIKSLREVKKVLLVLNSMQNITDKKVCILSLLILIILNKFHPNLYHSFKNEKAIPYRDRVTNSSFTPTPVSHKKTVAPLKVTNDSYSFECFLYDCLSSLNSGPLTSLVDDTISSLVGVTSSNYSNIYSKMNKHIVFNPEGKPASFSDYMSLVDMSFITN